ncbi:MAG: DUF2723 domain-containing protein [bacterium]
MHSKQSPVLIAILVFIITLVIYLATLSPTVSWGDSGEFITVAYTLGIGHPTSYPIYTLLGKLVTTLIPFGNIGWRLNLLSTLAAALSAVMLYFFLLELLSLLIEKSKIEPTTEINPKSEIQNPKLNDVLPLPSSFLPQLVASCGSLLFAFSLTFWQYAVISEVHTLQILYTVSLIYLWFKWYQSGELRFFYTSTLIYGLMLAHHLLSILLLPAFIILILKQRNTIKQTHYKPLWYALILMLFGSLSYLYLIIRSVQSPIINWNAPNTFSGLFSTLTGGDFKMRMFSTSPGMGMESASDYLFILIRNFDRFIYLLGQQWMPNTLHLGIISVWLVILVRSLLVGLGIIGLFQLYRKSRFWFWFSILVVLANLGAVINYQIADIEPYYLSTYLIMIIWIAVGLFTPCNWLKKSMPELTIIPLFLPIVLVLIPLLASYNTVNRHDDYTAYYYAKNSLESVEKNAVILTGGDNDIFPLWYAKYVEKINPKVTIFGSNFLMYPWYAEFFKSEPEFKFTLINHLLYSQKDWGNGLIQNIIEPNELTRPIYITYYENYIAQYRAFIPIGNFLPDLTSIREKQYLAPGILYQLGNSELVNTMINVNPANLETKSNIATFDDTISLRQCILENQKPIKPGAVFTLTLFWQANKKPDKDYRGIMMLPNTAGQIYTVNEKAVFAEKFSPVYSLISTSQWESGKIYREHYRVMIPLTMLEDEYNLTISLLDDKGFVLPSVQGQKQSNPYINCGTIVVK